MTAQNPVVDSNIGQLKDSVHEHLEKAGVPPTQRAAVDKAFSEHDTSPIHQAMTEKAPPKPKKQRAPKAAKKK